MKLFDWFNKNSKETTEVVSKNENIEEKKEPKISKSFKFNQKIDELLKSNPIYKHYEEILNVTNSILNKELTLFDDKMKIIYNREPLRLKVEVWEDSPGIEIALQFEGDDDNLFYEDIIFFGKRFGKNKSVTYIQNNDKYIECNLSQSSVVKNIMDNVEKIEKIISEEGLSGINADPFDVLKKANNNSRIKTLFEK